MDWHIKGLGPDSDKKGCRWLAVPLEEAAKGINHGMAWLRKNRAEAGLVENIRFIQRDIRDCGSTGWVSYFWEIGL